jgi:hypothetical protein
MDTDKAQDQSVGLRPLITSIELVSHNYSQGAELQTIFDEYLEAGSHKIIFEQPYYNIIVDGPGYTPQLLAREDGELFARADGENLEIGGEYNFGPNALYLEMQEAGQITITGYPWVDSKKAFRFTETGVTEHDNKNALKISDATLVSEDMAQTVLNQLRDYYRQRYIQDFDLFPTTVKIGDIILINSFFGKKLLGKVHEMELDLSGGYMAKTSIIGIEPDYVEPIENPIRTPRTGIALCGSELIRQNMFREYDHA